MKVLESKFDEIYKSNYSKVIRVCMGYVNGDIMLAKDLAQDVFIKVWENFGSFRNEASISTWIYRITVNTCLLSLRNKKIYVSSDMNSIGTQSKSSTEENKEIKLKQLYNCINKLKKENKTIILLELEGLPQKEIAKIMGLSHEVIRVRIHRIKNELTKCVKK